MPSEKKVYVPAGCGGQFKRVFIIEGHRKERKMIHLHLVKDGPILIKADEITIGVGPGQNIEYNTVAICRCGLSENKPLCDGAHESLAEGVLPEELISADNMHESSGSMTPVE